MDPRTFVKRLVELNAPPRKAARPRVVLPVELYGQKAHAAVTVAQSEIEQRERVESKAFYRGWESFPLLRSPVGLPVRLLVGRLRILRLAIDQDGQLRRVENDKFGAITTVSEAVKWVSSR